MPVLGQTPTEVHLNGTTPSIPSGKLGVTFQAGAAYPDPNNPTLSVRNVSAYVDPASSEVAGEYNASGNGVVGDGVFLYDGVITSGSALLSSASAAFTSADVGKSIEVDGAGVAGAPLITTILSFGNANQVTLSASASTSVVSGGKVVYGTDCTTALKTLIATVVSAGGGKIILPKAVYILNGALSGSAGQNALLPLPVISDSGNNPLPTLEIEGIEAGTGYPELAAGTAIPPTSGAVLYGMALESGSYPAILGGPDAAYDFTQITVILRNLTFRTRSNPGYQGIKLSKVANALLFHVTVDVNVNGLTDLVAQTNNSSAVGIVLPTVNNYGMVEAQDCYVTGYYAGIQHNEHARLLGCFIQKCIWGLDVQGTGHLSTYLNVLIQWCPYPIYVASMAYVEGSIDIEDAVAGHWWSVIAHVYGPLSGYLKVLHAANP